MATIKLQNDKVILNNGKVSCECCCIISEDLLNASITQKDCEDSLGKFCNRCGPKTLPCYDYPSDYTNVIWPTLPCISPSNSSGLLGSGINSSPFPGRYWRSGACIRFYYRIVDESKSEDGTVLKEGETASAARSLKSGVELWLPYRDDKRNLFVNESCGLYIYSFNFMKWHSACSGSPFNPRPGGSQRNEDGTCSNVPSVYNVDMFYVSQHGPYKKWPPNWNDPYWGYEGCPCG